MENKEEQRVLDQTRRGEDLEELRHEWYADAPTSELRPEHLEMFRVVTEHMTTILENRNPTLEIDQRLDPATRYALEALFEARMSCDVDTNEFISGLVRDKQLNQALMHLQPILAIALRPDFRDGRAAYDRLVNDLGQLRSDISSSIIVEMLEPRQPEEEKGEEQDDDDDAAGDGDEPAAAEPLWTPTPTPTPDTVADDAASSAGEAASAASAGEAGAAPEGGGSWFGRLLGRRGKKAPAGDKPGKKGPKAGSED